MLHILFGTLEGEDEGKKMPLIQRVDNYFNTMYNPEWLKDDFAKQAILGIDKSEVLAPYCIQSPVLGQIPPRMLSTGVKAVILMRNIPEHRIWATCAGDNCAKWILKAAEDRDVHIYLAHCMKFRERECGLFTAHIENTDTIIHGEEEYTDQCYKYMATHECEW